MIRHEAVQFGCRDGVGHLQILPGPEPERRNRTKEDGESYVFRAPSWPAGREHNKSDCGRRLDGGPQSGFV